MREERSIPHFKGNHQTLTKRRTKDHILHQNCMVKDIYAEALPKVLEPPPLQQPLHINGKQDSGGSGTFDGRCRVILSLNNITGRSTDRHAERHITTGNGSWKRDCMHEQTVGGLSMTCWQQLSRHWSVWSCPRAHQKEKKRMRQHILTFHITLSLSKEIRRNPFTKRG